MILCISQRYSNPLVHRAIILFNGKEVKGCVYADDQNGVIGRYALPLAVDVWDNLIQVWEQGKVRIIDPDAVNLHEIYTRCDRG